MQMALYRIENRSLQFEQMVTVPDDLRDQDGWLNDNGYGRDYTLRRGKIVETTAADIAALGGQSVPLPSYAGMLAGQLASKGKRK